MRYIAFIHKDPNSVYGVSFPDMPGCISAGSTIGQAVRNAVEALSGHVSMLRPMAIRFPPRATSMPSWPIQHWPKPGRAR